MNKRAKLPLSFPALVQAYFGEYLTQQRALSPQTVAAYRDGFVLFIEFAEERLGKAPAVMTLAAYSTPIWTLIPRESGQ